jgi:PKD repeat protein
VAIKELDTSLTPFPFFDDFEVGSSNWLVSDQDWDTTSSSFVSPDHSITDSPDSNYPYYANTEMILAHPIDLSNTTLPVLAFWHKYETQANVDLCRIEISEDGGLTWIQDTTYSGFSSNWKQEQLNLSSYKSSPVKIKFRLTSDPSGVQYGGWYIDDVEIKDMNGNSPPIIDSFMANPTSGTPPLLASFTCQAHDPDGSIQEFRWDFDGDGSDDDTTTLGLNNFTYTNIGVYNAKCWAVDDSGAVSQPKSVTINVYPVTNRVLIVPDTSAAPGETIHIPVNISDATGVAGAVIKLSYDPNILEALGASTTPLSSGFLLTDTVTTGQIAITMANPIGLAGGSGELVDITFVVSGSVQSGQTSGLVLDSMALFDQNTNPIPVSAQSGTFTVASPGPVANVVELFVEPESATLMINGNRDFFAYGVESDGDTVDVSATWTMVNIFGTIGNLSSTTGHNTLFTATGPGDGLIIASIDSLSLADTATVVVGKTRGDINLDDIVDVRDAIRCLQIIVGTYSPYLYQLWAADYDGSGGEPTTGDAIGILSKALEGLLGKPSLPAGSGPAIVSWGSARVNSDNTFTLPLLVKSRTDICGADLQISYNTSDFFLLEARETTPSTLLATNLNDPGHSQLAFINLAGLVNENHEMLTLKFKANSSTGEIPKVLIEKISLFDQSGNPVEAILSTLQDEVAVLPKEFSLHQNYPNPFNPSTTISFDLPKPGSVKLTIYNINGQLVRTLVYNRVAEGVHLVTWDGRDNRGQAVSTGIYFYRINFENGAWQRSEKMILMK